MLPPSVTRARRILLTTDAVGGVWRYVVDLVTSLDQAGFSCRVLGSGPAPGSARLAETAAWRRSDLAWTGHALDWMQPTRQDEACAALDRHARDWGADILHLHLPSQAAPLAPDLRVVAVTHSCQPTWWQSAGDGPIPDPWLPLLERTRAGLARADRVLAPTRAHADAVQDVYGPLPRLTIVPNAAPAPATAAPARHLVALAAGRWWDAGKNGRTLDEAAALTSVPILMAGPMQGPEGSHLALRHAQPLGDLAHAALRARMAEAALFVSPSLYEPFGLAVLEAAMHGCALVLADIPSLRELWNGAALYAEPRDPAAFARAIDQLAADSDQRTRLGAAARRRAARFGLARQRDDVIAAYDLVLAGAA